jgi:hypothetical protein
VIAVSAPSNHAIVQPRRTWTSTGEVERAQQALVDTSVTIVGKDQPLTLEHLKAALRAGVDIVYLVCHGGFTTAIEPFLYLQDLAGLVAPVKAADFALQIRGLAQAPRLMVLASCESATRQGATALPEERPTAQTSLAPLLANAGVSVVLAMQGRISMGTVKVAMPLFFKELMKDGQIDRALAVARGAVRGHPDYWMPALFLRLKGGRMWSDLTPAEPRPSNQAIPPNAGPSGEPVRERPSWDAKAALERILRDGPAEVLTTLDAYIPGDPATGWRTAFTMWPLGWPVRSTGWAMAWRRRWPWCWPAVTRSPGSRRSIRQVLVQRSERSAGSSPSGCLADMTPRAI